ncbi:MAG: ribonuclease Z [Candidatus Micrarchaeota archaeon]
MLRVVFLGSSAAVPSPGRVPSCFAVKTGSTFLFDCAEGVQRQMMKYTISYAKVDNIFLSHLHADHVIGVAGLTQTLNISERTEPLHFYGPKGTKEFLEGLFSLRPFRFKYPFDVTEVSTARKVFADKLVTVSAFPVKHNTAALGYILQEQPLHKFYEDKARSMGIKGRLFSEITEKGAVTVGGRKILLEDVTFVKEGRKIVYSGDTMPCAALTRAAKGADLLIHDSTFSDKEKEVCAAKFHSTAKQAAQLAKKAGAKKLVITHFSNRYADVTPLIEEARKVFPETDAAQEGKELLV